jgi:hypothetical protein
MSNGSSHNLLPQDKKSVEASSLILFLQRKHTPSYIGGKKKQGRWSREILSLSLSLSNFSTLDYAFYFHFISHRYASISKIT